MNLRQTLTQLLVTWEAALILLLIGVIILSSRLSPFFLDYLNLVDSTFIFSEKALIALPMALLIISRDIDVSVASIVALAAVFMGVANDLGANTPTLIAVGLLTGSLAGLANGLIVSGLGVHSIVVTIGTLSLFRGIAQAIVGDEAYTGFPSDFAWFGRGYIADEIPVPFTIYIITTIVFAIFLHRTVYGRRIYAIGTNPDASKYSGIPIIRYRIFLFVLTGFMCGLASVLLTSRLGSVRLNIATGWELQVVTMVVLGGVGISGGTGNIFGVTLAVFLIGLFTFGLSLVNVPGLVLNIYVGVMLLGAIALLQGGTLIQNYLSSRQEAKE